MRKGEKQGRETEQEDKRQTEHEQPKKKTGISNMKTILREGKEQ